MEFESGPTDVSVMASMPYTRIVLFAVGRGGNPLRHRGLIESIAASGCKVIAPHFDMLRSIVPTKAELDDRIERKRCSRPTLRGLS